MSALPRPDLPPGPHRDLVAALHDLHHRAGWPSLRTLARETGVSHTTVSKAFSRPAVPTWGTVELLVEAMDGEVSAFHDLWLTASTPAGAPGPAPRIAGRRAELTAVRRHLEIGTGLLLVVGEAGIGKTTLVRAASASGVTTAIGQCRSSSAEAPFAPIADALRLLVDDRRELLELALESCPSFVRDTISLLVPELGGSPSGVPDDWVRQRMFGALTLLLAALRRVTVLAIVIEDLHWADSSTLDLLDHLATRRAIATVGTWRTDGPHVDPDHAEWLARARRLPGTATLEIGNLSRAETAEQMALLLGADVDAATVDRLYARTLGQPLFTSQLAVAPDDAGMPRLLVDLVDARLAPVTGDEWVVARTLGVADRPLSATLIADAGGLDPERLTSALHGLADRHLLDHDDRAAWLAHPVLTERVRRRLVPGESQVVHARLADLLAEDGRTPPAEVAGHYRAADDPRRELPWRVRAAEAASSQAAYRQAAAHWRRALDIWSVDGTDPGCSRGAALLATVDALNGWGADVAALDLARESYAVERTLPPDMRLLLGMRVAGISWGQHGPARALDVLDAAISERGVVSDPDIKVRCLRLRSSLLSKNGRSDDALAVLTGAMSHRDQVTDPDVTVRLLATHGWHVAFVGDLDTARTSFDEARRRVPADLHALLEPHVAMMQSDAMLFHARPAQEVQDAASEALHWITELDLTSTIDNMVRANVAEAWLAEGRTAEAEALLPRRDPGGEFAEWPIRSVAGRIALARGRLEEVLGLLDGSVQNDDFARLYVDVPRAEALLWSGRPDEAAGLLGTTLSGLVGDTSTISGRAFLMLARAAADSVDAVLNGVDLDALRSGMHKDPFGPGAVPADRPALTEQWHAEVSRTTREDSVELWSGAAVAWEGFTRPHDAAYCRWRAAQCALRDGQGTTAARLLRKAGADAREHVPLSRAIAATAAGARA